MTDAILSHEAVLNYDDSCLLNSSSEPSTILNHGHQSSNANGKQLYRFCILLFE